VLRQALHLTPDGSATACFFRTDGRRGDDSELVIGRYEPGAGRFVLESDRLRDFRRQATRLPARCRDCVNVYHCARDCPDSCVTLGAKQSAFEESAGGFRCRLQKLLGESWILQAARRLGPASRSVDPAGSRVASDEAAMVAGFLAQVPPSIDLPALTRAWRRNHAGLAAGVRTMPQPAWAKRGFDHDGEAAWSELREEVPARGRSHPLAIYVHVPFCDRKCGFCDCYSLVMSPRRRDLEVAYAETLLREVAAWGQLSALQSRPVSTVHFGGGTPNLMSRELFSRLIAALRSTFQVAPHTEWALESTSSQLDAERLDQLRQWGFRRLHLGVQTMEPELRRAIGRRETPACVLDKLALARERGFIVSVDLIYGLPGQSVAGFVLGLQQLIAAGVHGASLYQMNSSARNERFIRRHGAEAGRYLRDFLLFQVGEQVLTSAGFRKNHFAHFARPGDDNLYYTHASRGEDLLALGTTADGIFGDYRYRHGEYRDYAQACANSPPGLQGGLRESPRESLLRPATSALLSGGIRPKVLWDLGAVPLVERWLAAEFVREETGTDRLVLTALGSWFLSDMLEQLAAEVASVAAT
jgi:oxygen-independent coproporphyrinogen-3 oxidase